MKLRYPLFVPVVALILMLGLTVACTRGSSDAQIANQVQAKIASDSNIQNKQIGVQSANGVVTLSGNVGSEMERAAAANDASQVPGVKTVVNNLQLTPASSAQAAPPVEPAPAVSEPAARPAPRRRAPAPVARAPREYSDSTPAPSGTAASAAPAPARVVTVPEGSTLSVRLIDAIDSETNQIGDTFRGTLSSPLMVGDEVVIPNDADVEGRVVDVKSAGHFSGQSAIALELTRLTVNGKSYQLRTNQYAKQGSSRGKRTAATVGGGAALGAIVGGIAGGGKGAAIGAAAGAGAGTGVQAVTKGQQIKLPSETVLSFQLQSPLQVTPVARTNRNTQRNRVDE